MTKLDKAIKLDIQQKIVEAAGMYEEVLKEGNVPLDAYLNLACLYWESTDYGFNTGNHLPLGFIGKASDRMNQVLEEAKNAYSNMPEIEFWKLYFDFTTLGEDAFPEKALGLAQRPNASLVPYFHVYDQTKREEYKPYIRQLLEHCKKSLTTKNRYIISLIGTKVE